MIVYLILGIITACFTFRSDTNVPGPFHCLAFLLTIIAWPVPFSTYLVKYGKAKFDYARERYNVYMED